MVSSKTARVQLACAFVTPLLLASKPAVGEAVALVHPQLYRRMVVVTLVVMHGVCKVAEEQAGWQLLVMTLLALQHPVTD